MAWDGSKPDNNGNIDQGPAEIRANWTAIEENDTGVVSTSLNQWAIHLIDRNTIGGSTVPTQLADISQLYVKPDNASNPELYAMDEGGQEVQLTKDGGIGGETASLYLSDKEFTANMLPAAMALVNYPGGTPTFTREVNFATVTNPSGSAIRLVTDAVFADGNVYVLATPASPSAGGFTTTISSTSFSGGAVTINLQSWNNNGVDVAASLHVVVFGGLV